MGTRHLTAVYLDGKYKVAQYGQWDGYPEGAGLVVLDFHHNTMNEEVFKKKLRLSHFITDPEYDQFRNKYGANSNGFFLSHPQFSRDTGAGILELIQKSENGLLLIDDINFAADSLFCEWAWVIDLDKRTFEGYKGFNNTPLNEDERFAPMENKSQNGYHPCKLMAKWSLDDLPGKDDFLFAFREEDEEEPA